MFSLKFLQSLRLYLLAGKVAVFISDSSDWQNRGNSVIKNLFDSRQDKSVFERSRSAQCPACFITSGCNQKILKRAITTSWTEQMEEDRDGRLDGCTIERLRLRNHIVFCSKEEVSWTVGEIIQEKWCHQAIWCRSFVGPTSVCLRAVQTFASAGLSSPVYKSNLKTKANK